MAPTFTREGANGPLYLLTATLPPGVGSYTAAFVPDEDPSSLPATLTLAQTWEQHPGTYVFLSAPPTTPSSFAQALATLLADPAHANARVLWIANPDEPPTAWSVSWLPIAGSGSTSALSWLGFRNVALWIPAGSAVTLSEAQDALVVTPASGSAAYVTAGDGSAALDSVTSPVSVSFADATAGCACFTLVLDNTGDDHAADVDRLDVGMRYFAPTPAPADPAVGGLPDWRTSSYRFPLLDPPPASLELSACLDPLNPLLPARTLFGVASGTTLASSLLTTTARAVTLTAGADAGYPSGFAFAVRTLSVPSRDTDPYYLVPSGAFTLAETGGASGAPQLMCGVSGVEYLTLPAVEGSTVYFVPGGAAYAPGFSAAGHGQPVGVTADATTAWAYVVGAGATGAVYHAQPDSATLYQPVTSSTEAGDTGLPTLLDYLELGGTALPPAVDVSASVPTAYPLVGLAALAGGASAALQVELQVISPSRRAAVAAIAKQAGTATELLRSTGTGLRAGATPAAATTPQGLFATFSGSSMSLTLGQSQGGARSLVLGNLQPDLAAAFQTNQLFLVATDKDALARLATLDPTTGSLTISLNASDTWHFDAFSDAWPSLGTALIFKFAGKSLLELLGDSSTWALGTDLNGGNAAALNSAQQRLLAFVRDAVTRADPHGANETDFAPFAAVAQDPAWNGILVLNCAVPLDGLPEQMSGIAAGIDASKFRAHHLGVTVTPVQASGSALTPQDSSLFGLVFYEDPGDIVGTTDDYRFKVNTLKVLFANSSVVSFSSTIELLVNKLFGDPVTLTRSMHGNNLVLNGVYQRQGKTSSYVFSMSDDSVFTADHSGVLDSVEIVKAQFVTVVPADKAETEHVQAESRFLLWGNVRFKKLAFDLFSYGDADGAAGSRLAFTNLAVDLRYDPKKPASSSTYTFDATRLALDTSGSVARDGSLFRSFPLTLTGFLQILPPDPSDKSAKSTTPSSLGYLGVDVPVPQGSLRPPWFGLVADLDLGSAGALAAKAGFTATLLVAWAPGKDPNVAVGLKLPGTGGAQKLLSLESVLKLKIQDIGFVKTGSTYVLGLHDITLSLLSLTFPPSGQTELLLFSDPGSQGKPSLGWYAGYAKDQPKKQVAPPPKQLPGGGG